jgi:lipoprotein-anchoring transpeptidase ErfK/SrfK
MRARRLSSRVLLVAIATMLFTAVASTAVATPSTILRVTAGEKTLTLTTAVPALITTASVVQTATVQSWVDQVAACIYRGPSDATSKVDKKHKKIKFTAAKIGYRLQRPESVTAIINELKAEAAGAAPRTVALPTTATNPRVTGFGKQILVVLSKHRIYLYNNNKIEKTYKCATGKRRYRTPQGTFHIGKKVKNPSWHNGYSSWSRGMPSYIRPGPNNPLGTRAMYVYKGATSRHDTGVRIHGVPRSENSSIGHSASHGCLRMKRKDVENLYPRVPVGTMVYIIK